MFSLRAIVAASPDVSSPTLLHLFNELVCAYITLLGYKPLALILQSSPLLPSSPQVRLHFFPDDFFFLIIEGSAEEPHAWPGRSKLSDSLRSERGPNLTARPPAVGFFKNRDLRVTVSGRGAAHHKLPTAAAACEDGDSKCASAVSLVPCGAPDGKYSLKRLRWILTREPGLGRTERDTPAEAH
eukprot:750627-Hanusia_phi.AAC.5